MLFVFTSIPLAYPSYRSRLPNGFVNDKATGHNSGDTALRYAFQAAGYTWTLALCQADSDGDGQTNGLELGDPCCVWSEGDMAAFTNDISIAGDAESTTSRTMP